MWTGQSIGFKVYDLKVEEDNSFFSTGDRSRFGNIKNKDEIVGHIFVAQKGTSVYSFILAGVLIDDSGIWKELFDERIKKMTKK